MPPSFWNPLRAALEEQRTQLSEKVPRSRGEVPGDAPDPLAEVDAALERMRNGTYGRCEQCEAAISQGRLQQMPAARLCFSCAAAADGSADDSDAKTEIGRPLFADMTSAGAGIEEITGEYDRPSDPEVTGEHRFEADEEKTGQFERTAEQTGGPERRR